MSEPSLIWLKYLNATPEDRMEFEQEKFILDVTERICEIMQDKKLTIYDLSVLLRKRKRDVIKLFTGEVEMTIRDLHHIYSVLGYNIIVGETEK